MCVGRIPIDEASLQAPEPANSPHPRSTCFTTSRLNGTTFQIVEDDKWAEMPIIYAKVYPSTIVLLDTGCGGAARDPRVELKSLRIFLETFPVADNGNSPLNLGAERSYLVICTHCHYDHIGGIAQFTRTRGCTIWASANDKNFLSPIRLPKSSLCDFVGMETPEYTVTNWCNDGERVVDNSGLDLGLTIYQTPGHTPDEVAIWDKEERYLFVGDSMYKYEPIIFPLGADIIEYSNSIGKLKELVGRFNSDKGLRVNMGCSHITSRIDASDFLSEVDSFLYRVVTKQVEPTDSRISRGELQDVYAREDGEISFRGVRRYFEEFRASKSAMSAIQDRQSLVIK
ncbi:hypothetical protein V500_05182 [Pseudogymnoascus sp. VKM F-4518 (FW-2643)]|nr:hypothetical protein V500_05182 [Pseudogymnoascus sp. VKM F-4518 (FW-2643)]